MVPGISPENRKTILEAPVKNGVIVMNYVIGDVTCNTLLVLHVTHTLAYIALRVSETANPIIYMYGTHD